MTTIVVIIVIIVEVVIIIITINQPKKAIVKHSLRALEDHKVLHIEFRTHIHLKTLETGVSWAVFCGEGLFGFRTCGS